MSVACDFSVQNMLDTEISYAEMVGIVFNKSDPDLTVGENILASIYGTDIVCFEFFVGLITSEPNLNDWFIEQSNWTCLNDTCAPGAYCGILISFMSSSYANRRRRLYTDPLNRDKESRMRPDRLP
jgi:hypothetical protein